MATLIHWIISYLSFILSVVFLGVFAQTIVYFFMLGYRMGRKIAEALADRIYKEFIRGWEEGDHKP